MYLRLQDAKQTLHFVKDKCGDNDQLPNKELTLKVTILLAFITLCRISALHILDLNHMMKASKYYEFRFHELRKSWRMGESLPSLESFVFPLDNALCVVAALDCYVERTSVPREENQAYK